MTGYYMLVEAQGSPNPVNTEAVFLSPFVGESSSTCEVEFFFHMFGEGFRPSSGNPESGELRLVLRLPSTKITLWSFSLDAEIGRAHV